MTFPEIFEQFKNHSYIRRKSWTNDVFIQLRVTTTLVRLVVFEAGKAPHTLDNDYRIPAEDLLGDDWIDIDDLMPKPSKKPTTLWEYIDTLENGSDEWRIAIDLGIKYHKAGKNPDDHLDEIIKNVKKS